MAKILKTICAYGNNYYDNDIQYIFLGVEEVDDDNNKAIPKLPILGIDEGNLEKCKNEINSLRSFLYPNVAFEIIANRFESRNYLLIVGQRQTGGPFMVSEKAERDKRISLKPGRYVRIDIMDNVTSVVIPVNEEYMEIKNETKSKKKIGIESETQEIKQIIRNTGMTSRGAEISTSSALLERRRLRKQLRNGIKVEVPFRFSYFLCLRYCAGVQFIIDLNFAI